MDPPEQAQSQIERDPAVSRSSRLRCQRAEKPIIRSSPWSQYLEAITSPDFAGSLRT